MLEIFLAKNGKDKVFETTKRARNVINLFLVASSFERNRVGFDILNIPDSTSPQLDIHLPDRKMEKLVIHFLFLSFKFSNVIRWFRYNPFFRRILFVKKRVRQRPIPNLHNIGIKPIFLYNSKSLRRNGMKILREKFAAFHNCN